MFFRRRRWRTDEETMTQTYEQSVAAVKGYLLTEFGLDDEVIGIILDKEEEEDRLEAAFQAVGLSLKDVTSCKYKTAANYSS